MAFTITDFHDLVRLLEQHEEWRKELRRLLLTDELLNLPNAFRELHKLVDRRFAELAEAQRRTEEALAAHRAETDRRFAELAEALRNLSETFTAHRQEFLEYRAEPCSAIWRSAVTSSWSRSPPWPLTGLGSWTGSPGCAGPTAKRPGFSSP